MAILYSTGDIYEKYIKSLFSLEIENISTISDTILDEFGHGKTSKVVKVEDRTDGRVYAMKIIITNSQHRYDSKISWNCVR